MPRVSVVIPVYGVEDYLALSVASVRQQTLEDIEIICVNDGSPDGSRDILALLEAVDPRIVVVDKPNGGLSSARNAGIARASGDFVCFLDADDLMDVRACEVIASTFERTGADVVTYGGKAYPLFRGYPWLDRVLSPRSVSYDGFDPALLDESSHPFVWRTACRRSFLEEAGVLFDESLAYGEDEVFQLQLYPRSAGTVLIEDKLVDYRVSREGSLMDQQRGNLTWRVEKHLDIASRVLADWAVAKPFEEWDRTIFDWAAELLLLDLISLPEPNRNNAAAQLRTLWVKTFGEEGAVCLAASSRFRVLASPIARGKGMMPGGYGAKARYYLSRLTPNRFVKVLRQRLASRKVATPDVSSPAAWEAQDARRRQEALDLLKSEVGRRAVTLS